MPNLCCDVEAALDASLERLQVPSVDLYQVHWPIDKNGMAHFANGHASFGASGEVDDSAVPSVERTFRALAALQAKGKVGRVGVCNFGVSPCLRSSVAAPPAAHGGLRLHPAAGGAAEGQHR